jgi:hypothetical protein
MRPKIAMWSDYGAPRHKHWRTPSRRSTRSSIGPKILVAAVVVVAGVIGISGIYPQIIDSEWVQGPSAHSQRVAQSEPTPTTRRSGIVAEIPLPPRRMPATTGEGAAPVPAATPTPAAPAPAVTPAPVRAATAPAPAAAPARVAAAPAPAATAPAATTPAATTPVAASATATSEMRPSVGAAAEQPVANPDAALAIADIPDAQAKADAPADPAAAAPAAPAVAARPVYAGRAPVVKRQRVVHVERRSRYSGAYAQWGGGGWGGGGFSFFGIR